MKVLPSSKPPNKKFELFKSDFYNFYCTVNLCYSPLFKFEIPISKYETNPNYKIQMIKTLVCNFEHYDFEIV